MARKIFPQKRFIHGRIKRSRFYGVGGGGGLPMANLALWLKADEITGLGDNDPVATWNDSSGNGNDATQATGADRPIFKTGIVNGLPVVRFDGTSDFLESPYAASDGGDNEQFWFAVFRTNSTTTDQLLYWMGDANGNGYGVESEIHMGVTEFFTGNNVLHAYLGRMNPSAGSIIAFTDTTNFHIIAARFTALTSSSPTAQIFIDGVGGNIVTGTLPEQVTWTGNSRIGRPSLAARFFSGDLAELLIYRADTQRTLVEAYLRSKYGLS